MKLTIEQLLSTTEAGSVARYYQAAKARWEEILQRKGAQDVDHLATMLFQEQAWFEQNCGGKHLGQEVMVVAGLAGFYSSADAFEGFEGTATRVYFALKKSGCSLEVKGLAGTVANFYGLVE
jgi:hypothetical protein